MPWESIDPSDSLSARRYVLSKSEGQLVERNPDKLPSFKRLLTQDTTCLMEVTGHGVLVFKEHQILNGDEPVITCALFTWDEILFD